MQKPASVEAVGLSLAMHEGVVRIFKTEPAGKQIYKNLAERGIPRPTIDLYRLRLQLNKGGFQINDLDLMKFFSKLAKLGIGRVEHKQLNTNEHSKFYLAVPMPFVVDAAKQAFEKPKANYDGLAPTVKAEASERLVIVHVGGRAVRVRVPRDLTMDVAEAIGATLLEHARAIESGEMS